MTERNEQMRDLVDQWQSKGDYHKKKLPEIITPPDNFKKARKNGF